MDNNPFVQKNSQTAPQNFEFDPEFFNHPQFQAFMRMNRGDSYNFPEIPSQQTISQDLSPQHLTPQNLSTSKSQIPLTQQYEQHATPNQCSSNIGVATDEEEEVDAQQPIFPPPYPLNSTQPTQPAPQCKRHWSNREEEALVACYMLHCTGQIISTNQKGVALWRKVFASYETARASHPHELPEDFEHDVYPLEKNV